MRSVNTKRARLVRDTLCTFGRNARVYTRRWAQASVCTFTWMRRTDTQPRKHVYTARLHVLPRDSLLPGCALQYATVFISGAAESLRLNDVNVVIAAVADDGTLFSN